MKTYQFNHSSVATKTKSIGVIGSRSLPYTLADQVGNIVDDLITRNYHIATGGAMGADQFVIEHILQRRQSNRCTIYSPWQNYAGFPVKVRGLIRTFKDNGGHLLWGAVAKNAPHHIARTGLLLRNQLIVNAAYGIVAFIDGNSRGSIYTLKKAASKRRIIVVFPHNCHLPEIDYVKWIPLRCGGCWEGGFKAVYLR